MPRDIDSLPLNQVRHPGQAVHEEAWIKALLHRAPVGVLATAGGDVPYINTNLYVFDEPGHAIYLHTALEGRTRANIEANERVCFSVMEMGRLLPTWEALEFSVEYSGVVVFGRARVIAEMDAARRAMEMLLSKYAPHLRPGQDYRPMRDEHLAKTSVLRIDIDQWSGKREVAPEDYPGAYRYNDEKPT